MKVLIKNMIKADRKVSIFSENMKDWKKVTMALRCLFSQST